MTDLEQDLLIAQAEAGELKRKLIEREAQLEVVISLMAMAERQAKELNCKLIGLKLDVRTVSDELQSLCQDGKPEPEEVMRRALTLRKLTDQEEGKGTYEKRDLPGTFEQQDAGGPCSGEEG